jgi:hypothetical protein
MKWKDDQKWLVVKDFKGGSCGLLHSLFIHMEETVEKLKCYCYTNMLGGTE